MYTSGTNRHNSQLCRGIGSELHVWVFNVRSWSSPVAGGGSGGSLIRCYAMDTSSKGVSKSLALLSTMVASGGWFVFSVRLSLPLAAWGRFGSGLVGCSSLGSVMVRVSMSKSVSATSGGSGGGLLYSQRAWGDFTLSLGVGAVAVGVSWVGVAGSLRADLKKGKAASIV